ncbi:hypothetical protein [Vibrio harveyi]|nr:hypothetical protein [Vibrio harveyi]
MVIEELESSDVIALCALLVAALSLAFTIWQGVQTRKHNVLMAKPVISFEVDITDTELISFKAINHGTGVAEVRSILELKAPHVTSVEFAKSLPDFKVNYRCPYLTEYVYFWSPLKP